MTFLGQLFRNARLTTVAFIASVAISLGAATALVVLIRTVVQPPLPFESAEALFVLTGTSAPDGKEPVAWLEDISGVLNAADVYIGSVEARTNQRVERLVAAEVSRSLLDVLELLPAIGRSFDGSDLASESNVVMISEELWRRWWAQSSTAIGSTITIQRNAFVVVGVFPSAARLAARADLFLLNLPHRRLVDGSLGGEQPGIAGTILRLRSFRDSGSALRALQEREPKNLDLRLVPISQALLGAGRQYLVVTAVAAGVILLAGTFNATLILMGWLDRIQHDLSVRAALGASYSTLVRHHAASIVGLMLISAAVGLEITYLMLRATTAGLPRFANVLEFARDATEPWRVVAAMAIGVSLACVCVSAIRIRTLLRTSTSMDRLRVGPARHFGGVTSLLVSLQIAAAVVVAAAANEVGAEFARKTQRDTGFSPEMMWAFEVSRPDLTAVLPSISDPTYRSMRTAAIARLDARVLSALREIPGVVSAGAGSQLPLSAGYGHRLATQAVGRRPVATLQLTAVAGDFLGAVGLRLISGRSFVETDETSRVLVSLVDRSAAIALWGREDVIGQELKIAGTQPRQVIGVVEPVLFGGLAATAKGQVYVLNSKPIQSAYMLEYVVRVAKESATFGQSFGQAVRKVDPYLTAFNMRRGAEIVATPNLPARGRTLALTAFAAVVGILTVVGLVGAIQQYVSSRRREISVRVALGCTPKHVRKLVVGRMRPLVASGVVLGGVAAWSVLDWATALADIDAANRQVSLAVAIAIVIVLASIVTHVCSRRISRAAEAFTVQLQ